MENAFNKLAGYKEEKKELLDICNIINRRDELKKAGGKLPKGLFLVGPTGVGKTKLAKAFIKESRCPYVEVSCNDMEKGICFGEYIKAKFKEAASKAPCIIFIDELDKFAGMGFDPFFSMENDKSQDLLNEINRYSDVEGLFLLLIANNDQSIDKALVRSGRIDKKIKITYPNEAEREDIIRYYSRNIYFDNSVNFSNLAKITERFTGADLESLINDAVIKSLVNKHPYITNKDIMSVYNDKIFSCKGKNSGLTASNEKLLAYHEAGHAAISLLNDGNSVFCATIMPRGMTNGYVGKESSNKKLKTTKDLKKYIKVCLAGMAAEQVFLNQRTVGSCSDIEKAQSCIKDLVRLYGIYGFDKINITSQRNEYEMSTDDCSEHKKRIIEEAEDKLFNNLYESVKKMLIKNKKLVRTIAKELIEKKVLNKEDIGNIYNDYLSQKRNKKDGGVPFL